MSQIVEEMVAKLVYKIRGAENLSKFEQGMDQTEKVARKRSKMIATSILEVVTAMIQLGATAYNMHANIETRMFRVGEVADLSIQQMQSTLVNVMGTANKYGQRFEHALAAFETLIRLNNDYDESIVKFNEVLKLSAISGARGIDTSIMFETLTSGLDIATSKSEEVSDILVAFSRAGKFELQDIIEQVAVLTKVTATLGYSGESGLRRMLAPLNVVRDNTVDSLEAMAKMEDYSNAITSPETQERFEKFDIDLSERIEKGIKAGQSVEQVVFDAIDEAIGRDLSQLPQLFDDPGVRSTVQLLYENQHRLEQLYKDWHPDNVESDSSEAALRFINSSLAETNRAANAVNKAYTALGEKISDPVNWSLGALNNGVENVSGDRQEAQKAYKDALQRIIEKEQNRKVRELRGDRLDSVARLQSMQKRTEIAFSLFKQMASIRISDPKLMPELEKRAQLHRLMQSLENSWQRAPDVLGLPSDDFEPRVPLPQPRPDRESGWLPIMSDQGMRTAMIDARADHRNQSVTVTVNQSVTQATDAPGAAAQATGDAVVSAIPVQRTQVEDESGF